MLDVVLNIIGLDKIKIYLWFLNDSLSQEKMAFIIANLLIWIPYILIPIFIFYLKSKAQQVHFAQLYRILALFCAIGSTTYILDSLSPPSTNILLHLAIRLVIAVISWITFWYILHSLPEVFQLRSQEEMEEEVQSRINAENTQKQSNERLLEAEVTAKLGYGHWDVIRDRIELSDNAFRILGLPIGTILSFKLLMEQVHPADLKFVQETFRKNNKAENLQQFYFRIVTPSMEVKHLIVKGENMKNTSNETIMVKIVLQDVSEIRRYMRRIELQNKKLRKIAWLQSHKMRSPIATIMGMATLINDEDPNDPINKEVLKNIKAESKKLDDIILEVENLTRQKLS
jgi:signal transduction histidine kinase